LIFSLLRTVGQPTREDFFAIYVLLTRINRGDNFKVIANPNELDFLDNLKPPLELIAFLHAYGEHRHFNHLNALNEYTRLQALHTTTTTNDNTNRNTNTTI